MPYYEYRCESNHEVTVQQRITDEPLTACPKAGVDQDGNDVECCSPCHRLISKSSFILKGAGWTPKGGI
jgi:putative FmdB family regulatory protein